jgi:phage terminase small subunit
MNPKRQRFVLEYLKDLNATQAAIRAGYSPRTANEQGARLLANASIRTAVQDAKAERAKSLQVDAAWVLRKLIANAKRAAEDREGAVVNGAMKLIGEHLGMFTKNLNVRTPDADLDTAIERELARLADAAKATATLAAPGSNGSNGHGSN